MSRGKSELLSVIGRPAVFSAFIVQRGVGLTDKASVLHLPFENY